MHSFYVTFLAFILSASARIAPLIQSISNNQIPNQFIVVLRNDLLLESVTEGSTLLKHHLSWLEGQVSTLDDDMSTKNAHKINHVYEMDQYQGYSLKTLSTDLLESIRARPEVDFIEYDQMAHTMEVQKGAEWGLERVSKRDNKFTGEYVYPSSAAEDVDVYVVDTGVNIAHVDFEGRAKWGLTAPDGERDRDGNGHGTHVASTIVGKQYGVAKKATVYAVKVLRDSGYGSYSDVLKGIEFVGKSHKDNLKTKKSTKSVANMSLGGGKSNAIDMAVNAVVTAGVHFVVAAGNENADACSSSPAGAAKAITVGASDKRDKRAYFSNIGKCVDVFGPGVNIKAAWNDGKNSTNTISGTSMASPHVAGVVALLVGESDANIGTSDIKALLLKLATKDVLSDVPSDTKNLLAFTNPKTENGDSEDEDLDVSDKVIIEAKKEEKKGLMATILDIINRRVKSKNNKAKLVQQRI